MDTRTPYLVTIASSHSGAQACRGWDRALAQGGAASKDCTEDAQTGGGGWRDRGNPSPAGRSLDLRSCSTHHSSGKIHQRTGTTESQTPHRIASRPTKPILFNHIDRWVFRCAVVVTDPPCQSCSQLRAGLERVQIDALVFQTAPQPLDEHVAHPPAAAVHRDPHTSAGQHLREPMTR